MKLLKETLAGIEPADNAGREEARRYIDTRTRPRRALGRLLDLAEELAAMNRTLKFSAARKEIVLMAGDHGIVAQKVCPQPSSVTTQMVYNFVRGGAGINVLSRVARAHVSIVDMGVASDLSGLVQAGAVIDCKIAPGTADFSRGPAMSREQAVAALEAGIRVAQQLAPKVDVFATGEMGLGNTSPSSAIVAVLSGLTDPAPFVGRGAGLDPSKLAHKAAVIRRGIELNRPDPADGVDVLAKVGGFEIGGIAGLVLGAARLHKPVVVHFKRRGIDRRGALLGLARLHDPRSRQRRAGSCRDGEAARQAAAAGSRHATRGGDRRRARAEPARRRVGDHE